MADTSGKEADVFVNAMSAIPGAVLQHCFSFIGKGHYRHVAGTSRLFRDIYSNEHEQKTEWKHVAASVPCSELCLEDVREMQTDERVALDNIVAGAVGIGNVEVLEWARNKDFEYTEDHFIAAALHSRLNVLQWAEEKDLSWYAQNVLNAAATGGNVNILEWIHTIGREIPLESARTAAFHGHVEVLSWMNEHGLIEAKGAPWISESAASGGRINVLDWFFDNGFIVDARAVIENGAVEGHKSVLVWAREHGIELDQDACAYAAWGGQLPLLQWLREIDCPWGGYVFSFAYAGGHGHIEEWAIDNGCPLALLP